MGESDSIFEQTASIVSDGGVPVKKFRSSATGLTVCLAEAEGPLVAGYICIATEAYDDDGLPHTLEHLIFLGSEDYPYKGILDMLSNRCLSSGTNAWTDTDHTCYTMMTAGQEGFLKLLPIYMDHIFYPTLTDAGYNTEVHHVNGEGEDGGVVYCEMQCHENNGENKCHLGLLRAMYPGHCGYKSEVGGCLKNLRESTNNDKVRAFHKQFYRPENVTVIIVGQIEAENVFKVLQPIEAKIKKEGERPPYVRPWQSPVPPLLDSVSVNVQYPCDEDEFGLVIAGWRASEAKDHHTQVALEILMAYLMDTSISPLQREFVEIPEPLCSTVDYTLIENSVSCVYMHFANVPVKKLDVIKDRLLAVLKDIADGTEEIDMKRMSTIIHKKELYILTNMESNAHKHLTSVLIGDFLYGSTNEDLEHRLKQIPLIREMGKKSEEFWCSLLKKYFLDGNHVFVLGSPSPVLAKETAEEEKERIKEQQRKLGPDGLKLKGDVLKKSIEQNEIPAPPELIQAVSVPSVESIKLHSIQRFNNYLETCESPDNFDLMRLPSRFQLDFVQTNFIRMYALLDTGSVPQSLRLYLPLFIEMIDESPIMRDGELVPYQEVVKELSADTVSVSTSIGTSYSRFYSNQFAQVICIRFMLEEDKYLIGIQWLREILFQTVFCPSRVKVIANKMLTDISSLRRDGNYVSKVLMRNLCFTPESNHWVISMMRQYKFLTELCEKVESCPDEVVKSLNELREIVTDVGKITIHLAMNKSSMPMKDLSDKPWIESFLPENVKPSINNSVIQKCYELLEDFSSESKRSAIVGLSSVESSFAIITAPCITSFSHKDYPALLMLTQYLTQLEGPLWRQIRGLGLSYGYRLNVIPSQGVIIFSLFRSTSLVKAYQESVKIIEAYLNKEVSWDTSLFESACSSLMFQLLESVETVADVVCNSMLAYYKDVGTDYTKELLRQVSKVTLEDMERVGSLYLKPLFDPIMSKSVVCCHSSKVPEVVAGFKQSGRELTVLQSLEDDILTVY